MFKIWRSKDSTSSQKKAVPKPPDRNVDKCNQAILDPLGLQVLRSPQDANIECVQCIRLSWCCISDGEPAL